MKNKTMVSMLVLFACLGVGCQAKDNGQKTPTPAPIGNVVGGDRDEHGCIGSAGYSWCQAKQKCLRPWEETCEGHADATPKCAVENCHGMDIKCGPNPAEVCTAMYGIGDKCLQYAKCGVQDGQCQQVADPQFTKCKTCVQACINANQSDSMKMFDCESKCN